MSNIGKTFKTNNGKIVTLQKVTRKKYELYCNQCYFFKANRSCVLTRADMFKGVSKQFTKDVSILKTLTDHIVIPECYDGDKITSVFKMVEGGI